MRTTVMPCVVATTGRISGSQAWASAVWGVRPDGAAALSGAHLLRHSPWACEKMPPREDCRTISGDHLPDLVSKVRTWMACLLSVCLVLGELGSVSTRCSGQEYSVTYTNLSLYLTNRAWVKEMEIDLSKNRYQPANYPPESYRGLTTWRGSLQPGGFLFQCVSNSPFDPMLAYGESSNSFWQTSSRGISTAPKNPEEGGSDKNGRQIMCLRFKRILIDALNFGIEGLDNEHITWVSPREFTSPLLDWTGKPTSGSIHVRIEAYSQDLPSRLQCETITGSRKRTITIQCLYDQPSLPPTRTVCEMLDSANKTRRLTNIIRGIVFGLRDDPMKGFLPSDLLPADFVPTVQMVASNGSRYIVLPDGSRRLVDENVARDEAPILKPFRRRPVFYLILSITILCFPVAISVSWLLRKARSGARSLHGTPHQ